MTDLVMYDRLEDFLWACARGWRDPEQIDWPEGINWSLVARWGKWNRMGTLLNTVITARGWWPRIPAEAAEQLRELADKFQENTALYAPFLVDYLDRAQAAGIETILLKGVYVSDRLYGEPAMRPGGDIDILVKHEDVEPAMALLDEIGIGQFWPNLMDNRFYERHHLHQQRSNPELSVWFEIHWALDHPYTLLTIDYPALLERATQGQLFGAPVLDPDPIDLMLTLIIHLVKHAVYLTHALDRTDLKRVFVADGQLLYFLDIVELLSQYGQTLDWQVLIERAHESNAGPYFGAVLRVCRDYFESDIPDAVLQALPIGDSAGLTRWAMQAMVEYELSSYLGEKQNRFWSLMLSTNGAFILRPVRVLETVAYVFPPRDYFMKRYGRSSILLRGTHALKAGVQFMRFAWDSVYFALERYARLRKLGYSTSLFNRLETEG
jgi:hypothetical protein